MPQLFMMMGCYDACRVGLSNFNVSYAFSDESVVSLDQMGRNYGWAFGLPEKFRSGISGFIKFGFSKMLPEIYTEKSIHDISGI